MDRNTLGEILRRLGKMMAGYTECRGVFCVVDDRGRGIHGVHVSYRVGDGDWSPCGVSQPPAGTGLHRADETDRPNYIQPFSIFYRMGEPVSWRFHKPGFSETVVTRYVADMDSRQQIVTLRPPGFMHLNHDA